MSKHICDCGMPFSDIAGLLACQANNHSIGCDRCRDYEKKVKALEAQIMNMQAELLRFEDPPCIICGAPESVCECPTEGMERCATCRQIICECDNRTHGG